jgi:SAM-dependent methyltransferase
MDNPLSELDPTGRFTGRADEYARSRPGYPVEVVETLRREAGLTPQSVVADVGSGTGILSELFLRNGNVVYGVEPNADMRSAAMRLLGRYPQFRDNDGTAEQTGLPDASVDLVAAGQAFHWFDPIAAREEFRRILRPPRMVALVWNDRRKDGSPFMRGYEQLLANYGTDFRKLRHETVSDGVLQRFFFQGHQLRTFPNFQDLDRENLRKRAISASYLPKPGEPGFEQMIAALDGLFLEHQSSGRVRLEYQTLLFFGPVT